jgi:hypothetical protein
MIVKKLFARVGAYWGLGGVILLLASAIYRLSPLAVDSVTFPWNWHHWLGLIFTVLFMAYFEGYRAFQQAFSPRVAARARYLRDHFNFLHVLLAPFFCMAYFHAPLRRRITSVSVTAGIIVLVILVRLIPQPWRGIIDGGVIIGLAWGVVTLLVYGYQAFMRKEFSFSPEVPEEL